MKKILSLLVVLMLFVTGCGNKNVDLDLDKVSSELDNMTIEGFYLDGVYSLIDQTDYFENLEDIYDYDFQLVLGLDGSNIDDYSIRINKDDNTMYALIKPVEGKEDVVKSEMNAYFESINNNELVKNRLETEYKDYLIYIVSSDNDKVLEVIKSSKETVFSNLMAVEGEMVDSTLNITSDQYSEILMKIPMIIVKSNMYIIIKPTDGNKDKVKSAIDEYMVSLEKQWETYLPDQYELVKNRKYEEYGGYLIYIVSVDNVAVFEAIKNNVK